MMYYPKLQAITPTPRETLALSQLATGKQFIAQCLISERWEREILSIFRKRRLINWKGEVIKKLPAYYSKPFIYINKNMLKECGLIGALMLGHCRGDLNRLDERGICRMLKISRATFYNAKRKLNIIDKKTIENLFKSEEKMIDLEAAKKKVTDKHLQKFTEAATPLQKVVITNYFLALCSTYGYRNVPQPSRADMAKATNAMKNSDLSVGEIIERLVSNWNVLVSIKKKPKLPDLGMLPICLKEISGIKIAPKMEKSKKKQQIEPDVDTYIEDTYFD